MANETDGTARTAATATTDKDFDINRMDTSFSPWLVKMKTAQSKKSPRREPSRDLSAPKKGRQSRPPAKNRYITPPGVCHSTARGSSFFSPTVEVPGTPRSGTGS